MEGTNTEEQHNTRRLDAIFKDFQGRRQALIKALTTDFNEFHKQCDPNNKEDLCLYGLPNGKWEVKPPVELVPSDEPEPLLGINSNRDKKSGNEWLLSVAAASDSWLLEVAFCHGGNPFSKADRSRLFTMINALPTLYEIVSGKAKEKPSDCNPSRKRFKPSAQAGGSKSSSRSKREKGKERVSSDSDEACGACRGRESHKDWICCDFCNNWFHDVCVNITPDEAEKAATYECPYCSNPGKQAK